MEGRGRVLGGVFDNWLEPVSGVRAGGFGWSSSDRDPGTVRVYGGDADHSVGYLIVCITITTYHSGLNAVGIDPE